MEFAGLAAVALLALGFLLPQVCLAVAVCLALAS
jgi:hypothetical protein